MNPKPIYKVSASFLTNYQGCSQRIQRGIVERLEETGLPVSIEPLFGSCFHCFRENYVRHGFHKGVAMASDMFDKGSKNLYPVADKKKHITASYLNIACSEYAMRYPITTEVEGLSICFDGDVNNPMVETYFSIPVIETPEFELHLSGKIDAIGLMNNVLVIEDIKTTSQTDPERFFSAYANSPQMRLYSYVVNKMAEVLPDSAIGKMRQAKSEFAVSILGVFLKTSRVIIERSNLLTWTDQETKEYASILERQLLNIAEVISEHRYYKGGMVTGACKGFLSQCPFYTPCHSSNESMIISNKYTRRP